MNKQPSDIPIEHFKNLVAIAYSDGILEEVEEDFLYDKAEEIGLPFEKVDAIIQNANELEFILPEKMDDREDQLADIVFMSMMDGELHDKEYALCVSIAQKLGLDKTELDEVIDVTRKLWDQK